MPAHIQHSGQGWEWLPPAVAEGSDGDGPMVLRAVVIVEEDTTKGTARCPQEYVNPLVIMSGEEWQRTSFTNVMSQIEVELEKRYGDAPSIVVISPSGKVTKIYKDDEIEPTD